MRVFGRGPTGLWVAMIEGFIGRPGSGKSYELTRQALAVAKAGRPVFSNMPIVHPNVTLIGPSDLAHVPAGLVVLDEVHLWLPARLSMKLPASWLALFSQTRKNGWDVIWSAQHESRVDRVLRDTTGWMWYCEKWFGKVLRLACYEPERFRSKAGYVGSVYHVIRPGVYGQYDTMGRIVGATHTYDPGDPYAIAEGGEF